MNIRDRILRLATEAESAGKADAANALYLLGGMMELDGSQCEFFGFVTDPAAIPDFMAAVAIGVGLSLKLPPVETIPEEEYALTWPMTEALS